jgi:DNA modification methylase
MCGDSTNENNIKKLMDGKLADMVFTDPPYGISIVKSKNNKNQGKVGGENLVESKTYSSIIGDETTESAKKFYNTCINFGFNNFIIWGGNYFTDFLFPSSCWVIWDKENSGNFADVEMAWTLSKKGAKLYRWMWNGMSRKGDRKTEGKTRVHPTQKPVGLFVNVFKDFDFESCFDGFGGSGSTLIACEQTNRICYMMELEEKYCDVIIARWEKFTGKQATKIEGGEGIEET